MPANASVLVVEDRKAWRDLLCVALDGEGHTVECVATANDALAMIVRRYYHVAILDLNLKELEEQNSDGIRVLRAIHERGEPTKAIVLTAFGTVSLAIEAFRDLGVFDFVEKQALDNDKFRRLVRRAISEARKTEGPHLDAIAQFPNVTLDVLLGKLSTSTGKTQGKSARRDIRNQLNALVTTLMEPLVPVIHHRRAKGAFVNGPRRDAVGFEAQFWSRQLGRAVYVRFGERNHMPKREDAKVFERLVDPFIGVVYEADTPFDEFDS